MKQYRTSVEDRLGPIWYAFTKRSTDLLNLGTVETTFEIPAGGGKPQNVRVISNTGGRWDELIARQAMDQLRAPPIPNAVLAEIKDDTLQFEESFTIFQSRH